MNLEIINEISKKLNLNKKDCEAVLSLLEDKATVPFIARYRKEMTHGMDENQIRLISDEYEYLVELEKRKDSIKKLIAEKGLLNDELSKKIDNAKRLVELEDIYRPYKEGRQTKASKAIQNGLKPLACYIMTFPECLSKEDVLKKYISDVFKTTSEVLENALYIIADVISDSADYRKYIREDMMKNALIKSVKKKDTLDETMTYKNYYEYSEGIKTVKNHRVLALTRGEKEGILNVSIIFDDDKYISYINKNFIKNIKTTFLDDIKYAIVDGYKRLIKPSIEREIRQSLFKNASEGAIEVFSLNLKNLLLQAPIKGKTVLGIDPAFRTGCKMAVVDKFGMVLDKNVIYPNERKKGVAVNSDEVYKSKLILKNIITKYNVDIISIGNGTASRETEEFVANTLKEYKLNVKYAIVSEAGASVYSASKLAQEEFPEYHVEERSAVSIARRLQDPLAELVKIEPKAIGVGQYQHDVSESMLTKSLDAVVEDAVNMVGVDINTASEVLLSHVSGISKTIASNIVEYRNTNNGIKSRQELLKVSKLGPKTYEQAVGFIRVPDSKNILDNTSIHPESYDKAKEVMAYLKINSIGTKDAIEKVCSANIDDILKNINVDKYTLEDILKAIKSPTRDPREEYAMPKLRDDIKHFEDLKVGDKLSGVVRNVVDFGAFVDCGVKYDGLVHKSKMSKKFVSHPKDIVKVGDIIDVYVIDIDKDNHKLQLSMIE